MKGPVKVAIIGLGGRGKDTYSKYVNRFPEKMQIVAIADPIESKRKDVAAIYGIPEENCYASAEELLAKDRLADVAFICTPDKMHYPHAMAALEKGYHLLLEKPVSTSAQECADIAAAADPTARFLQYWTLKESISKKRGVGLSESFQAYAVRFEGERPVCPGHKLHFEMRGGFFLAAAE